MTEQCILVVEDEAAIRDMLNFTLTAANYKVIEAPNAEQGWKLLLEHQPDCVLLDWMLPGVSGVSLAQRIRQNDQTAGIPIIMLTARGEENDQVQGFDAGADDYVVKPFSPRALVARVKALLRRQSPEKNALDVVRSGDLKLDLSSYRFTVNDQEVKLGPTEFKLMHFFMTHSNRVYTRVQLLDQVWGENVVVEERTVDVHIRRLRKLLEPVGAADTIQTVRGAGYRFSVE
ncbi:MULTISPECIES: phosphate regulon transcriptional regulator PhoB [Piscirickettsiaceae]|jgi:two-component system phosphate regulon response regulator PhoB|uniref:Phosphate regulon transcriptional regulatory protein PhoB n=1 Tax=Hydrogenovibrio thermophilus TaxID=265883 RepID=A0A410H1H7_9GAMM|nr:MULTISPECIES: phosphate regulon transcriptional regulator PhoB [Piscirickettsiaceae]AZR82664.1 two-component system response regulator [Thiomicrospira sp. S5]QAB14770.1 phosphate regulon transcriptional regulatory protein PhoB [Hydrogenovibrio thermophilus]